jgi:predicted nucleic acid-binding protein
MTGLDCNILVQLALQDHPANLATVACVQTEVQNGNRLVFPPLVINEFLHVITDARRFNPPLTMVEALDSSCVKAGQSWISRTWRNWRN